ncbi:MAG TPA: hypothetical protein VHY37_13795 [Tepidisphaeraceae bacterium]|jgi:REP element-mobilizing transposase RayT|nr:hypothetical protein [Tepidisphaeraceae bacterium]
MKLLAYHITWGTYGTRLHGDPRNTVDRQHNQYGERVLGFDEHRWEREKTSLKFPPVLFTIAQRVIAESLLPEICQRGGWIHRTGAVGPDHVHVILTSQHDPKTIRRLFKRWLHQTLDDRLGHLPDRATWWAECGSTRWIFAEDGEYYANAIDYVTRQRATPGR